MTDVDRLLQTYIERFEAGDATDPSDLLDQAKGSDRARLSTLIEGYLEHAAPPQQWDAEAFEGSVAMRAAEMVQESWAEESSALPAQLVALRKQAELPRSSLIDSLAKALGAKKKAEREKVAGYYNAMEHGQLEPQGISSKVFDALAGLLGTSAEALRKAGEAVAPSAGGQPRAQPSRARSASRPPTTQWHPRPPAREPDDDRDPADWDEIDRLFRGGGDA